MLASILKKLAPAVLAFGLLLTGCQDTLPQPSLPAPSNADSSSASSGSVRPKGIFYAANPPSAPIQLDVPSEYDLLVAAESAVRAILTLPLPCLSP